MQGLLAIEIVRHAMQAGVVTRDGMLAVLGNIRGFDSAGLGQPLALDRFPYQTSLRTRVLKPDLQARAWTPVGGWASPLALDGVAADPAAGGPTAALPAPR
jgi:hypothetical protein